MASKNRSLEMIKKTAALCLSLVFVVNSISPLPTSAVEIGGVSDEAKSEAQASAEDRLLEGLLNYESEIDLSAFSLTLPELERAFVNTIKDCPYFFYVNNKLTYTYRRDGYIVAVRPIYDMPLSEAREKLEYCTEKVKEIAALIGESKSELELLIDLHDILCLFFSYDVTLENDDIYKYLTERSGTCQGYTWTYMAVLRELGFECEYVASDSLKHIWLLVKIDGEWYHSDPTWDDPPRYEGSGRKEHRHVLFSDQKALEMGYFDWYSKSGIQCGSQKYDNTDFSALAPACREAGDILHSGTAGLYELVTLDLFLSSQREYDVQICRVCADINRDLALDEYDIEFLRKKLLSHGES